LSTRVRNWERLRSIKTIEELLVYLKDELDWPLKGADVEDVTFEYTPEELGLEPAVAAKIDRIHRLRPMSTTQPWGIFFVDFEPKNLPVTALRRILGRVVLKKRVKGSDQTWHADDLLFISTYGQGPSRQICLAHFSASEDGRDLPTLKVLGWNEQDTGLYLQQAEKTLVERLAWPEDEADLETWRKTWSEAFTLKHREVIDTAKDLSIRLAALARDIRDRITRALVIESETGPLKRLMHAFQEALVHNLDEAAFADMYAQTIAYGLLSARITDPDKRTADDFAGHLRTSPFLRELMETFLKVGGRQGKAGGSGVDFDELGVSEVIDLLDDANMEAVVRDFGKGKIDEDPVIHFYEHFLREYNQEMRVKRGVFYTPRPVVSYIVRSVDELLRTEFGLEDGLADTATWGEMAQRHPELKLPNLSEDSAHPRLLDPEHPFVQILDPATGTGTFLVEVIEIIHQTMTAKWAAQGKSKNQVEALWNNYVPRHLLPRLHGYELLMAPYAIAHLKVGLKLHETGYRFGSDERARIYLTNALEPGSDKQITTAMLPALAHEALVVNAIKRDQRFTVVIGNPPYSSSICEPEWLMRRLDDWKHGLNETKSDLNREEWKFLRFAQHHCQTTGAGIVGLIINRDFLDGIVKRRMREHLCQSFPLRIAVDLNGDAKGNISDENVFEIEQGVTIAVLCSNSAKPSLRFTSRVGTRAQKYADLVAKEPVDAALADITATAPYFRWVPYLSEHTASAADEYSKWPQIKSAFGVASSGIQTKRDGLCVAFTRAEMWEQVQRFHDVTAGLAREVFDLDDDGRDWTVAGAKADVAASGPDQRYLCPILYRPFDIRFTYWTGRTKGFLAYPRREVMQHIVGCRNVGMIFNRQIVGDSVSHFGVSRIPICHGTFYLGNKGQDYFAPMLIFDDNLLANKKSGRSNFTTSFISELRKAAGTYAAKLTPEDIFHYGYAVFHSPSYRSRYEEFLKIDFPRLPLPGCKDLFHSLAPLGEKLVALHLLESPALDQFITTYVGPPQPEVSRVRWLEGTVWLDAAAIKKGQPATPGSMGFKGVPEEVWNFHIGGYQVCEKWLKDRKGRRLSDEDIAHYQKIVVALKETIRLMGEIDEVIERHGGWPGAFVTGAAAAGDSAGYEAGESGLRRAAETGDLFGEET